MKLKNIMEIIENFCPVSLAYEWDNVGLMIGDKEKNVEKIIITLDVDKNTVKKAINTGCDLIISHHPLFFRPLKNINYSYSKGKLIRDIIKNDIAVYSAHTNMDVCANGINKILAEKLCLFDIDILDKKTGLGRIGYIKEYIRTEDLAKKIKKYLDIPFLRIAGDKNKIIKKAAVACGSCSELIPMAIEQGCDAFISGDIKYHEALDNTEEGICIIDAGHFYTEVFVKQIFGELLKNCGIQILYSDSCDIFTFI